MKKELTYTYTHTVPQDFVTSGGQVAVNKPKGCSTEEEWDPDSPLVTWNNRDTQPHTSPSLQTHSALVGQALIFLAVSHDLMRSCRAAHPKCSPGRSSHWLCSHGWCDSRAPASQTRPPSYSRGIVLPPTGRHFTLQWMTRKLFSPSQRTHNYRFLHLISPVLL